MPSPSDLVELTTARSPLEAEWLVGALQGHGVRAVVFGDTLADEFAVSQQAMGLAGGVRLMVARGELDAARTALAHIEQDRPSAEELEAAFEAAPALEHAYEPPVDRVPTSSHGKTLAIVLLTAAVVALGWVALRQRDAISAWEDDNPFTTSVWRHDRWEARWRHNGELASVHWDRDGNGVFEEVVNHDRDGTEGYRLFDENENGIFERFEYPPRDGVREVWLDADEDTRFERYEFVDVETGAVLDAFEDRGRQGFVRVK